MFLGKVVKWYKLLIVYILRKKNRLKIYDSILYVFLFCFIKFWNYCFVKVLIYIFFNKNVVNIYVVVYFKYYYVFFFVRIFFFILV